MARATRRPSPTRANPARPRATATPAHRRSAPARPETRSYGSSSGARSSAGSQASSQGRLLLDPTSLSLLGRHLERVMGAIQTRLETLNRATELATQGQFSRAADGIAAADNEIARFRALLGQIDELELEFEKIARIREIVRGFRARVEALDRRVGR